MAKNIKTVIKKEYEILKKMRDEKVYYINRLQNFFFCDDELYETLENQENEFVNKMIDYADKIEEYSIKREESKMEEIAEIMMKEIAEYLKN